MNYSIKVITLLICALLSSSIVCGDQSPSNTIKIDLFKGSSLHWIAIAVQDGDVDTTAVQIRDSAQDAQWVEMQLVEGWNHWVANSNIEYVLPLSFRLVSDEQEITVESIVSELGADISVDTGVQYTAPRTEARGNGGYHGGKGRVTTTTTTRAPRRPTKTPTNAPTKAPSSPSTKAPSSPSTKAPVAPVITKAPVAPVTSKAPTTAPYTPTTAPSSGASSGMGLMVPLYTYPTESNSGWDIVAANGKVCKTMAIVNPDNGPGSKGQDTAFKNGMKKLQANNVEMIGYVSTVYGTRNIATVKADIAAYAAEFPEVVGIFLDEAAADASKVSYYAQLHEYIMSMPGYKYNVLNPGAVPVQAYFAISTQIVSYESTATKFATSKDPSYASAAAKDHFSVISYGATSSQYKTVIDAAKTKGYYGWVYFTDNTSAATYNTLPSYYAEMAKYTASK